MTPAQSLDPSCPADTHMNRRPIPWRGTGWPIMEEAVTLRPVLWCLTQSSKQADRRGLEAPVFGTVRCRNTLIPQHWVQQNRPEGCRYTRRQAEQIAAPLGSSAVYFVVPVQRGDVLHTFLSWPGESSGPSIHNKPAEERRSSLDPPWGRTPLVPERAL